MRNWTPEQSYSMADHDHNSFHPESTVLNTTLESPTPELTHETATQEAAVSPDYSSNPGAPVTEDTAPRAEA